MKEKYTLGLVEPVVLLTNGGEGHSLVARIDTGATSSSIDLTLAAQLELGPITKSKVVKSASGIGERPIVKAKVKINGNIIEAEFTLADRSHMTYQMLIGQNILKMGHFIIDPLKQVDSRKENVK